MPELKAKIERTPFTSAIDFLKNKRGYDTETYKDLVHEMHDRAFVIAGCMRDDVLKDVQKLIIEHMEKGTPPDKFEKEFRDAIRGRWLPRTKTGDDNTGWRARVIYDTNIKTAYAAGRYQQFQRIKKLKPYWRYCIGESKVHRPEHVKWDGLVLSADDPWWDTHSPPNGWGCNCFIEALDKHQVEALGKDGPDVAPPSETQVVKFGDHMVEVPKGIDPGWAYCPGKEATLYPYEPPQGKPTNPNSDKKLVAMDYPGNKRTYLDYKRPKELTPQKPKGQILSNETDAVEATKKAIGGDSAVFQSKLGHWKRAVFVDAKATGGHIKDKGRIKYLGLIKDAIENPQEVWAQFMQVQDKNTGKKVGKTVLRWKLISSVNAGGKNLVVVCEGNDTGGLDLITFYPVSEIREFNKKRIGRLVAWK